MDTKTYMVTISADDKSANARSIEVLPDGTLHVKPIKEDLIKPLYLILKGEENE